MTDYPNARTAAGGTITGTAPVRNVRDITEGSKSEVEKVLATAIKEKAIGWRRKEGI